MRVQEKKGQLGKTKCRSTESLLDEGRGKSHAIWSQRRSQPRLRKGSKNGEGKSVKKASVVGGTIWSKNFAEERISCRRGKRDRET